jgi:hypothetical protein
MTIERPMFPPRAESVDSFPLQAAGGQPGSQARTRESRKPVDGLSRRLLMTGLIPAIALPIAAALPVATPADVDPIFAAIEKHKALTVPYDAAWKARGCFNDFKMTDEETASQA